MKVQKPKIFRFINTHLHLQVGFVRTPPGNLQISVCHSGFSILRGRRGPFRGCWGSRVPSGDAGGPGPLDVLALQEPLQLFKLRHCLILHIRVWDLQPDAVCRPAQLSREHLCQDLGHHRNHLRTRKPLMKRAQVCARLSQLLPLCSCPHTVKQQGG